MFTLEPRLDPSRSLDSQEFRPVDTNTEGVHASKSNWQLETTASTQGQTDSVHNFVLPFASDLFK